MKPVKIIEDADLEENGGEFQIEGGSAIKVRGVTSGTVEGGALTPIYVLTAADIDSGRWRLQGGRVEVVLSGITTRPVSGHIAIPVYPINSDEWPSVPVPVEWLLRDDFFPTGYSAGDIDGTDAEEGPGTRNIIADTGNNISINSGIMEFAGGTSSYSTTAINYDEGIVRSPGVLILCRVDIAGSGGLAHFLQMKATVSANNDTSRHGFWTSGGVNLWAYNGGANFPVDDTGLSVGTHYLALLLRDDGVFHLSNNGATWNLLRVSDGVTTSPLYLHFNNYSKIFDVPTIRVVDASWLPVPLASDGFSLSNTDGLGHAEGVAGGIGSGGDNLIWTENKGTWTGGTPDTLDGGQAIKTVDVGVQDVFISLKITRGGGQAAIILRYIDNDNYLRLGTDATSAILIERVAGVNNTLSTTAITYVANAPMVIRIEGQDARIYYNNAFVVSASGIDAALIGTRIGLFTNNLGNSLDDLVAYSSTGYSNLNQYIVEDTQVFSPINLSGMELWLDANDTDTLWQDAGGTTPATVGDPVARWDDKSTNLNNAIQATGSLQPSVVSDGRIDFDGTDDYLEFTELTNIRTVFIVCDHSTGTGNFGPLLGHPTLFHWHADSGTDLIFNGNASPNIKGGTVRKNGKDRVWNVDFTLPTSRSVFTVQTTGDVSAQTITNDRNLAGRIWNGDYSEIIIYSRALTDDERDDVETYLINKWNIRFPSLLLDGGGYLLLQDGGRLALGA